MIRNEAVSVVAVKETEATRRLAIAKTKYYNAVIKSRKKSTLGTNFNWTKTTLSEVTS